MIPYPGESLSVDSFTNVSGAPVGSIEAIQLRAGSSTFTAGDSVRLSSDLLWQYMEGGETVVVSWVVEVLSGSGTFTLSEGIGNTATSLGSHTVTGPTTLVVPSLVIDGPTVYADTDARLLLSCTSGTVEVQQVKLRVWPPEGVAGGWSSLYPSWAGESPATGRAVTRAVHEESFTNAGASADWTAAILAAQTHAGEPWAGALANATGNISAQTLGSISASENAIDGTSGGTFNLVSLFAIAVSRSAADPSIDPGLGLVEGVDYIVPPDEVAWDAAHIVDAVSPTVGREWVNTVVTVTGSTTGDSTVGAPTLSVAEYTEAPPPFATLPISSWPDSSAATLLPGENAVAVPDVDAVLFAGSHTWMTAAPAFPGGTNVRTDTDWVWALGAGDYNSPDFLPLSTRYTYPAYRLWSPVAVPPQQPLRLMQRSDGLGMGSGRVLGVGTRQASTRVLGSL